MSPLNVAIYVRVSTQEQKLHGLSVGAQVTDCQAWVSDHKHRLVGIYNDAGLSARAKYTKRREMLRLLDDVKGGRIDLIIFTKLDRWFRNVADYYEVQAILEAHNVRWRAIQEDYETETASGRFKVNIMLAVAQDEADRTSERIKVAAEYKRQRGEAIGKPAVGYKIENKHWVINEKTKPGVEAFFKTYHETQSYKKAIYAASEFGVSLTATKACRMLRNPTYYGDAYGVPCPAYITREQFDEYAKRSAKRMRVNDSGRVYYFSGLLKCGYCGSRLGSCCHRKKTHDIKSYSCTAKHNQVSDCPGCYVNEKKLEAFLVENLLDAAERSNYDTLKSKSKDNTKELQLAKAKLERLKELYIDGEIDRQKYDAKATILREEISRMENAARSAPKLITIPAEWSVIYSSMSDDAKKVFWRKTVREIIVRKGQPPEVIF